MKGMLHESGVLLGGAVEKFSKDNCFRMAASLAYYTTFSLPPLLVIVIALCGLAFEPSDVKGRVAMEIRTLIGREGAEAVRTMIENASRPDLSTTAALVGLGILIFGATTAFAELQYALDEIWEVEPDPALGGAKEFFLKRVVSLGMVAAIAFLLMVSLLLTAALAAAGDFLFPNAAAGIHWANFGVTLLVITFLFAAMFKVLPDAQVGWKDVWIGAAVTAVLFALGKFALGYYLGNSPIGNAFGAAGSLAIVMAWIYYSGLIFLFGAEFTCVWSCRFGKHVPPEEGAVRVVHKVERVADDAEGEPAANRDAEHSVPRRAAAAEASGPEQKRTEATDSAPT